MTSAGSLITDSEVIQELMHVYLRREGIEHARRAIGAFRESLHDQIAEATLHDILNALAADLPQQLQSRDRVHLAVMQRLGITHIISTDRGFDLIPGIRRLDPLQFDDWRDDVFASP
jgi:predicted nucleic acid-binding protein